MGCRLCIFKEKSQKNHSERKANQDERKFYPGLEFE